MKTLKKPIDCESAMELMFDYIDGSLPSPEREALDEHISKCAECKNELSRRSSMLSLVKAAAEAAPSSLSSDIMKKIEFVPQEKAVKGFKPSTRLTSAIAIAACAVIMLAVGFRGILFSGVSMADGDADTSNSSRISEDAESPVYYSDTLANADFEINLNEAPSLVTTYSGLADAARDEISVQYGKALDSGVYLTGNEKNIDIDKVYDSFAATSPNRAVVIGYESYFGEVIPDTEPISTTLGGIECKVYTVNENCLSIAAMAFRSDSDNLPFRAFLPSDVIISELSLIIIPD